MTKSVAELCREQGVTLEQLVEQSGLEQDRIVAIIEGRWTPSPKQRSQVAAALGVTVEDISWGHKTPIQHLWGHGPT